MSSDDREFLRSWALTATEAELAEIEELLALNSGDDPPPAPPEASRWTVKTLGEVAGFFGMSVQTVKQWRTGPDPMPGQPGAFRLDEIAQWKLRKADDRPDTSLQRELDAEKTRLENQRLKLRLQKDAGLLISREVAKATIRRICVLVANRLQAVPAEVASGFPPEQRPDIIENWNAAVRMILKEIESYRDTEE